MRLNFRKTYQKFFSQMQILHKYPYPEITYLTPLILSLLKILINFLFGTVLRTSVYETTHTHVTQSLKKSVSLFYSYILFLTKNGNTHLDHPPYSQDLAPNGFCLFPKFKFTLKRRRFATTEDIQNSMTKVLKIIPKML